MNEVPPEECIEMQPRMSEMAALVLWKEGAIKLNLDQPFTLVSGNLSPIYINCRQVISSPNFMSMFTSFARFLCAASGTYFEVIAGGESAGIPFAAYLAQNMALPMAYVRKSAKEHGIAALVEGRIVAGANVLLVEDLITDAASKMHFITAVRAVGATVKNVLVLFDREQGGAKALQKHNIQLHAITNVSCAVRVARAAGAISVKQLRIVEEYLGDPKAWHSARGFDYKDATYDS
jgi:orotate phosphoribosyltransferase